MAQSNEPVSVVFFGTGIFASVILEHLLNSEYFKIVLVATQPSRPVGRKQIKQGYPVKNVCDEKKIKVLQPADLDSIDELTKKQDLNIIVDYGIKIPNSIIDLPKFGSINIHPSLLPKYRGPSPLQTAILNGDSETGISIMLIDEKMDHGPILAQTKIRISDNDNYSMLNNKVAIKAANFLPKVIKQYIAGVIKPVEQMHDYAIFCKLFNRESGKIDFNDNADRIFNQYRATIPWPGLWSLIDGKRIIFKEIKKSDKNILQGKMIFTENKIFIGCSSGSIEIIKIQLAGGKEMMSKEFINGYLRYNNYDFLNKQANS
ncbi:MAG: methionyl-tRNA formyltransferase [bacterium]